MTPDEQPVPHKGIAAWYGLGVCVLLYVVSMIDRTILAMLIQPIKRDLHLGDFQISLLMGTAFGICYVLFSLPFGWASDRFSRPVVIAFGLAFWSVACAGGGLASSFAILFVSRMLVGAGEASLSPSAYSLITETFPRSRLPSALAIYHYGGSVGGALALLIGGFVAQISQDSSSVALPILGSLHRWQLALAMIGLSGLPLALLALTIPEPRRRATSAARAPIRMSPYLRRNRRFIACHFAGFSLILLVVYANAFWQPAFLVRTLGWPPQQIGSVLAALTLGGALTGQFVSVRVIGAMVRAGYADAPLRACACVLAVGIAGSVLAFATRRPALCLTGIFVSHVAILPVMTYGSTALQMFVPADLRGRISGLFLSATSIVGLGVGPALVGLVTQYVLRDEGRVGLSLLLVSVLLQTVGLALLLLALRPMRYGMAFDLDRPR